jgi:site-specific DNA recombinase
MMSDEDIEQARADLAGVLKDGETGERKAVIEAHVGEIKINGHELIPVFTIPTRFRTLDRVVGRAGLEPATEGL